jgi:hypothetical protein
MQSTQLANSLTASRRFLQLLLARRRKEKTPDGVFGAS